MMKDILSANEIRRRQRQMCIRDRDKLNDESNAGSH